MVEKQLFDMAAPFEEGISARFEEEETDELTKSINKARKEMEEARRKWEQAAEKLRERARKAGEGKGQGPPVMAKRKGARSDAVKTCTNL